MATQQVREQLVVGALVQWERGKEYGVVTATENNRITVRWDDSESEQPTVFGAMNPPLSRVNFAGKPVMRKSTGEHVAVLSPAMSVAPTWRCQVFRSTGSPELTNIPEADLRPLPITDPVERFRYGEIGSTKRYLLHQATLKYQLENLQNELVSLSRAQVDLKPHQVAVAHKVISNYPHRFLLCDEVGLGKTIQAGMVLKEFKAQGLAKRVLVICPPNLVRQWQFEMKTKFNEELSVLNAATVRHLQNQGYRGNPFNHRDFPNVICSSRWVSTSRMSELCAEADWDLIIIDEAHHARRHRNGSTTQLYRLAQKLAGEEQHHRRSMLFLTATPMQLHASELYSLVELLDPVLFLSESDFNQHQTEMGGLSRLVGNLDLLRGGETAAGLDNEQTAGQIADWLEMDANEVRGYLSPGNENLPEIIERLMEKHRLSEVLIRNRKANVGGFQTRNAERWEVELSPEERAALEAVEEYVRDGYQFAAANNANAIGFLMSTFQKLAASSSPAILESLRKRREKVSDRVDAAGQTEDDMEETLDTDSTVADVAGDSQVHSTHSEAELLLLDEAIATLEAVKIDSKAQALLEQLAKLFDSGPNEKVLIFTQFRDTQNHLAELMKGRGWGVNLFHGQMGIAEKGRAIERFKNNSGSQILISTEAGGEGRNLQFCHLMVNYDLPWNPMRVEQRIGRIDRINQEHPIKIFNLSVKGTIEDRILEILERRIRIFEQNVGGLDPILNDLETDIRAIMRNPDEISIEEMERNIEQQLQDAREADRRLDELIMDTKSFRREIAERIRGKEEAFDYGSFELFIQNLLQDVDTVVNPGFDRCELVFRGDFYDANRQQLFPYGRKMSAVLRPDRGVDAQEVELMTFGHEVIDTLVAQVLSAEYEGATGTRRIRANSDLAPAAGWLFLYQFTIPGTRETKYLEPVFVSDGGEISETVGRRLLDHACRFTSEGSIPPETIPSNLEQAKFLAEEFAANKGTSLQNDAATQGETRIGNEVSRLARYYDYREQQANDKMEQTRATLNRIRESDDLRIVPVWEANLRRDESYAQNLGEERRRRIAEAERHRYPQVSWALKSLGRIEVVAGE